MFWPSLHCHLHNEWSFSIWCALGGWCICRTGGEANSLLSASLTAAAISNLFMLRHLGACIDEREKLRVRCMCELSVLPWCCCCSISKQTAACSLHL